MEKPSRDDILSYSATRLGKVSIVMRPRSGEQLVSECPFCHWKERETFAVSLESGAFHCYRQTNCGAKGSYYQLKQHFGDIKERPTFIPERRKKTYVRPPEPDRNDEEVLKWLSSRGIDSSVARAYGVADGDREGVVVFVYKKDEVVVHLKYRELETKRMWTSKDSELVFYGRDIASPSIGPLVVTEGEIDAMSWRQAGVRNAVSIPAGADGLSFLDGEMDWLRQFPSVYVNYDSDAAGKNGSARLIEKVGRERCFVVNLPMKDANDCLCKARWGREEFRKALHDADKLAPAYIRLPSDYSNDVDLRESTDCSGIKTGVPGLDKILGGWRMNELTIWTGRGGSGKSTFINQAIVSLVRAGEKALLVSFEMPPGAIFSWMMGQINDTGSGDVVEKLKWLSKGLIYCDADEVTDPDEFISLATHAVLKEGVRHVFLDSFMLLDFESGGKYDQERIVMKKLKKFVRLPVHLHIIAHPRKGENDFDAPGVADIAGTSLISNLAHNIISIWRPQKTVDTVNMQFNPDMLLTVRKNRMFGLLGEIKYRYNGIDRTFYLEEEPAEEESVEVTVVEKKEGEDERTELHGDSTLF